jgi:hypothetical protein
MPGNRLRRRAALTASLLQHPALIEHVQCKSAPAILSCSFTMSATAGAQRKK